MTSSFVRSSLLALATVAATASFANAGTPYDGRWSLSIVTQHGTCDTYNFPVNITNGAVTFPGLVKASGRVTDRYRIRSHGRTHTLVKRVSISRRAFRTTLTLSPTYAASGTATVSVSYGGDADTAAQSRTAILHTRA